MPDLLKLPAERRAALAQLTKKPHLQYACAKDPHRQVRAALSRNPALLPTLHSSLAADPDPLVRLDLAKRPDLTERSALVLAEDRDPYVQETLAHHTPLLAVQLALVSHCPTPPSYPRLYVDLAQNPSLHPEVQAALSYQPHPHLRHVLHNHPALVPSEEFALSFLRTTGFWFEYCLTHYLSSDWDALADQWTGSLASFRRAVHLLASR